jgi:hypothetical protein
MDVPPALLEHGRGHLEVVDEQIIVALLLAVPHGDRVAQVAPVTKKTPLPARSARRREKVTPCPGKLRTGDFFDAPNHPKITFKSTSIEAEGEGAYVVHGDLGIRGVTKSVALEVEFHGVSKNPYGKTVTGLNATGTINRKDFGVAFNAVLETGGVAVGEKVKLELDIEAIWAE